MKISILLAFVKILYKFLSYNPGWLTTVTSFRTFFLSGATDI